MLTGPSSASLVYDPLLRLYQESGSLVATTTLFQYSGKTMIGEYDTSAVMQRRYVPGSGSDEPLVEYDKSGGSYTRVWLHADERGSIVAESNDSGAKTAINTYDEFGVPASGNAGRFGYTGQAWLPSLGIWYYRARMYAPRLGRFMQTDPIGYDDGQNWYNYVASDPVNFKDPDGNACVSTGTVDDHGNITWGPLKCDRAPDGVGAGFSHTGGSISSTGSDLLGGGGSTNRTNDPCSSQNVVKREKLEKLAKAFDTASNVAFGAGILGGGASAALGIFGIVTADPAAAYFGGEGVEASTQFFTTSTILGVISAGIEALAGRPGAVGRAEISGIVTGALSKAGLKNEYVKALVDKLVDRALQQSGLNDPNSTC